MPKLVLVALKVPAAPLGQFITTLVMVTPLPPSIWANWFPLVLVVGTIWAKADAAEQQQR
jgi:hypothetical protein